MNHADHSWQDCPELNPPAATGFLDPTKDQLNDARRLLVAEPHPVEFALHYVGAMVKTIARGDFDSNSIRRAVAMYRVWDEEIRAGVR